MVKSKNNPRQVIMAYMIMALCGLFSINLPGDAGDKWVSLSGDSGGRIFSLLLRWNFCSQPPAK